MAYMAVTLVSGLKATLSDNLKANSGFFLQQEETSVSLFTLMIQCIQSMVSGSDWNYEKVRK